MKKQRKKKQKKVLHPLNERFMAVTEALGYSGYSLAKELGITEASISYVRNGKQLPGTLAMLRLLEKHKEINANWLFLGQGKMIDVSSLTSVEREHVEKRLVGIEKLLKQFIKTQIDRNLLVDEVISSLQVSADRIEDTKRKVKKGRGNKN